MALGITDNLSATTVVRDTYRAVAKQGRPCMEEDNGSCKYIHEDDDGNTTNCAVGHWLPDKLNRELERCAVGGITRAIKYIEDNAGGAYDTELAFLKEHEDLLRQLQEAHDNLVEDSCPDEYWPYIWYERCKTIAKCFDGGANFPYIKPEKQGD